jgi:hypothetical protein
MPRNFRISDLVSFLCVWRIRNANLPWDVVCQGAMRLGKVGLGEQWFVSIR